MGDGSLYLLFNLAFIIGSILVVLVVELLRDGSIKVPTLMSVRAYHSLTLERELMAAQTPKHFEVGDLIISNKDLYIGRHEKLRHGEPFIDQTDIWAGAREDHFIPQGTLFLFLGYQTELFLGHQAEINDWSGAWLHFHMGSFFAMPFAMNDMALVASMPETSLDVMADAPVQ